MGYTVPEVLTMNVEFYKDNSGRPKKMHHFQKNRGGGGGGGGGGLILCKIDGILTF